jgi:hypothetical protein
VQLHSGIIVADGQRCFGLTEPREQIIRIADIIRPDRRIVVLWHELVEAWKLELDPHRSKTMDAEAIANMVGIAMAAMSPSLIASLHAYMLTGIEHQPSITSLAVREDHPAF